MLQEGDQLSILKIAVQEIHKITGNMSAMNARSIVSNLKAAMRGDGSEAIDQQVHYCLRRLPHSDLCSVNAGVIPPGLMKRLQKLAYKEIERRRMTR